jgi:hypothetical protein
MTKRLGLALVLLMTTVSPAWAESNKVTIPQGAAADSTKTDADALAFIQTWTDQVRAGRAAQAFEAHLDANVLLIRIFAGKYTSLTDEQRGSAQRDMMRVVRATHANPALRQAMMQSRFGSFATRALGQERFVVDYVATLPGGKTVPNTLLLFWRDGQWRIADMGTGGQLVSAQLREETTRNLADVSVNQWTSALADTAEARFGNAASPQK